MTSKLERDNRRSEILKLILSGVTETEISRRYKLSQKRVSQIVQELQIELKEQRHVYYFKVLADKEQLVTLAKTLYQESEEKNRVFALNTLIKAIESHHNTLSLLGLLSTPTTEISKEMIKLSLANLGIEERSELLGSCGYTCVKDLIKLSLNSQNNNGSQENYKETDKVTSPCPLSPEPKEEQEKETEQDYEVDIVSEEKSDKYVYISD